jgi:hypothetical protein
MSEEKPIWKHSSVFMTVICFIAFYLGKYKEIINPLLKTVIILAGIYALLNLSGISIEIIRNAEVLLRIF